ncbi:MAG: AIR synthase-related protein, partial [Pseudohongiellaceae bacterium]
LAGHMQGICPGEDLEGALQSMEQPQELSAHHLEQIQAHACTDVSGFGLLGHLAEMLPDDNLQAELLPDQIPVLAGARELADRGVRSSLHPQNEIALQGRSFCQPLRASPLWPLLLDPQTAGGLLAAIPASQGAAAEQRGFVIIGTIL